MLPPFVRKYLLMALSGTPDVLDGLLKGIPDEDPLWDFRPDPERFTLREVVAHLADWEPIFLERMVRIQKETASSLLSYDEGQFALDRDYAHQSPQANLRRFREGRPRMVAFLRSLEASEWLREGRFVTNEAEPGEPISMEGWLAQVAGHDGYHMQQTAQWLAEGRR